MKRYLLTGVFPAKDLDNAFNLLAEHFRQLSEGEDPQVFDGPYNFNIEFVDSNSKVVS
jgi:hypothetical protein